MLPRNSHGLDLIEDPELGNVIVRGGGSRGVDHVSRKILRCCELGGVINSAHHEQESLPDNRERMPRIRWPTEI
jgi:hypothetical protein